VANKIAKPDFRNGVYCTSFCNKGHRLRDGLPVEHECYVLPTAALHAEVRGDMKKSKAVLQAWKTRRMSAGVTP
jgi:hypothetical protein